MYEIHEIQTFKQFMRTNWNSDSIAWIETQNYIIFFSFLDSMIFLLCQLCHYAFCTRMVYMRRSVMFCILKISKKVSNSAVCMIGHDFCSVLCCWCCHLNRLVSNLILNGFFWFSLGVLSSLKPKNNKIHF